MVEELQQEQNKAEIMERVVCMKIYKWRKAKIKSWLDKL
jgi:hypothetical protein